MKLSMFIFIHLFSQVNNGATFVRVNKFKNPRDGNPSLLVQGCHIYNVNLFIFIWTVIWILDCNLVVFHIDKMMEGGWILRHLDVA
jgi:hypothetical protein